MLFAHVSRTGGVAVTAALRGAYPDVTEVLGQHDALAAARPVLGAAFDEAFKFAFVRNPWERFVSWYALIGQVTRDEEAASLLDPASAHWKGFDAFLESWAAETVEIDGVPRRKLSQWAQLTDADGVLLTDALGRFETFRPDALRLLARAGIEEAALPRMNASRHLPYAAYFSDFGRELVADAFRDDVVRLRYAFEF